MALITKKHVTERETASYKLDRAIVELVRSYSEFIGSPQEHVVNESLRFIFRKDREFNNWLKANGKLDLAMDVFKESDRKESKSNTVAGVRK